MTAKRSRNYHDQHRWKKKSPKIDRLRKKPVTDPLREDVTVIPCRELLSSISFRISCHPQKRTRKIEKGKNYQIHKRKKIHKIFDISSPSVQSVARVQKSEKKKRKKERKKIKKQKRVSRNDKIRNSFRQRRQWNRNQRAL